MFEKTDDQLVVKALQGSKNAWLKLLKRYEQQIYNYGIRMTGNRDDAMDLMQEVFVSVFRNLSSYRQQGSFKSWLFKIAHYRCIEFYRRKRPTQGLDDAPEPLSDDVGHEQHFAATQDNQRLIAAMQTLPLAQKAVIELKFFGQFTFEEIAEQLGISSNTAKSRMYAALDKLRGMMEVEYA